MIVEYFEASVLCQIERPGSSSARRCLDDYHRTAWRLYCGGRRADDLAQRPFIFRVDEMGSGRCLFTLRCDHQFPGASARRMSIESGRRLGIEWLYLPTLRPGRSSESGQREGKRVTPDNEQWPELAAQLLERKGLAARAQDLRMCTIARLPRKRPDRFVLPVVRTEATVTVTDPGKVALAWLDGVGPMRSYGFGMLTEGPERVAVA
jgi:hypothetical protein